VDFLPARHGFILASSQTVSAEWLLRVVICPSC
jgi:hypothetical protein